MRLKCDPWTRFLCEISQDLEPLGPDPPWKPRDPLVERLFTKEIVGIFSDRKRKLSEDSDHGGTVEPDKVDEKLS